MTSAKALATGAIAEVKDSPVAPAMMMFGGSPMLSAFLDNLTTVLLMVPITFLLADALDIDPIPVVTIEIRR